jgi:hypothetical protein
MIDPTQVVWRLQPVPYIFPRPFTVIRFVESLGADPAENTNILFREYSFPREYVDRPLTKKRPLVDLPIE